MTTESFINVTVNTPKSEVIEQSETRDILVAVIGFLSFFSVLGTFGNLLVLYVYVRKRNKLASTVFIITLAFTDFITCVVIIPYTIILEYVNYNVRIDILCKLYMFLITSNVPFSAFIMTAIAVDRYLCICHPFTHILNKRMAKLVISMLALIAFTLGIITALNFGVYHISTGQPPNSTERTLSMSVDGNVTASNSFVGDNSYFTGNSSDIIKANDDRSTSQVAGAIVYVGVCRPNGILFSLNFTDLYQKVYSSFFVIVIVVVIVLYVLIYRFVSVRRARRRRMRSQSSMYSSYRETAVSYVNTRASLNNGCVKTEVDIDCILEENAERPKGVEKNEKTECLRRMTIREKGLVANIRTASMLFVVTAVFIIVFLPAWLMAHQVLPYNMLIFYMYFFYNVANPIIYAFMNKAFRRDLKDVIECRIV